MIEIKKDNDSCFCNACFSKDNEEGSLINVGFVQNGANGSSSQSFRLCRTCALELSNNLLDFIFTN